ncbi:hypothetical protein [Nonomuraea sp. NPDC049695]|uniref:hypothetical protein n=1 Tax=Nonomuraea sp. NPDC049695 TaxID=3154734 RepID=UPI0034278F4D
MVRFWKAARDEQATNPPAAARVHVDDQHGTVQARDGGWVTVQLDNGAITNVLADRAVSCNCAEASREG